MLAPRASRGRGRPGVPGSWRNWPPPSQQLLSGTRRETQGARKPWSAGHRTLGSHERRPSIRTGVGEGCTRRGCDHQRRESRPLRARPPPPGPAGAAVRAHTLWRGSHGRNPFSPCSGGQHRRSRCGKAGPSGSEGLGDHLPRLSQPLVVPAFLGALGLWTPHPIPASVPP